MGNGGGREREKRQILTFQITEGIVGIQKLFFNLLNRLVYFKISYSFSIAETVPHTKTSYILDTPLWGQRRY